MRLAAHHTDVDGLVLVNPALASRNPVAGFAGVLKHLVPRVAAVGNDIAKPGMDEGAYEVTPVSGVHTMQKLWSDVRSTLDLVT